MQLFSQLLLLSVKMFSHLIKSASEQNTAVTSGCKHDIPSDQFVLGLNTKFGSGLKSCYENVWISSNTWSTINEKYGGDLPGKGLDYVLPQDKVIMDLSQINTDDYNLCTLVKERTVSGKKVYYNICLDSVHGRPSDTVGELRGFVPQDLKSYLLPLNYKWIPQLPRLPKDLPQYGVYRGIPFRCFPMKNYQDFQTKLGKRVTDYKPAPLRRATPYQRKLESSNQMERFLIEFPYYPEHSDGAEDSPNTFIYGNLKLDFNTMYPVQLVWKAIDPYSVNTLRYL